MEVLTGFSKDTYMGGKVDMNRMRVVLSWAHTQGLGKARINMTGGLFQCTICEETNAGEVKHRYKYKHKYKYKWNTTTNTRIRPLQCTIKLNLLWGNQCRWSKAQSGEWGCQRTKRWAEYWILSRCTAHFKKCVVKAKGEQTIEQTAGQWSMHTLVPQIRSCVDTGVRVRVGSYISPTTTGYLQSDQSHEDCSISRYGHFHLKRISFFCDIVSVFNTHAEQF